MSQTLQPAQDAIDERLREIKAEQTRLERALKSLQTGAPARSSSRRGSSAAGSRAPRGQRRQQVLDHLQKNAGARPSEIAKAIGASPNQVHGLIRKLRDEKLLRKSGKGYKLRSETSKGANA